MTIHTSIGHIILIFIIINISFVAMGIGVLVYDIIKSFKDWRTKHESKSEDYPIY